MIFSLFANFDLDVGFISIDQEKAFNRISHSDLKKLEAFGIVPAFTSYISLLYHKVFSVL